jgi:hypothetical protein
MTPKLAILTLAGSCALFAEGQGPIFGPVRFEENRGQTDSSVRYAARAGGHHVFLTDGGVVLSPHDGKPVSLSFPRSGTPKWSPIGEAKDSISYYLGNNAAKWVKSAPVYDRIVWREAYPGIDIAFYGSGTNAEYDLIVAPHADPSRVRLRFSGPSRLRSGAIEIQIGGTTLVQRKPEIYQQLADGSRRKVEGRFVEAEPNEFRLQLAAYERSQPLVIDPVLELATYVGGEQDDEIVSATHGFVAGHTRSWTFPNTPGAIRRTRDLFIRGTGAIVPGRLAYNGAVVFGGSGDDQLAGIVADTSRSSPRAHLAGTTTSQDLPAIGTTYRGGPSDGFVATFDAQFSASFSASYFGGSGEDRILSIGGAGSWTAIAGITDSPDLPVSTGSPSSLHGGKDAFYAIGLQGFYTNAVGYLGGSGDDAAYAVGVRSVAGSNLSVWIGGETRSSDFPEAGGGLKGASDAFLTQITASIPTHQKISHRIGGAGEDRITALVGTPTGLSTFGIPSFTVPIPVAGVGFAGTTTSPDLPVANALQERFGGERDAFAGMWDVSSATPKWLTYLGGSGADEATTITQNWAEDLYVGGATRSTDLPVVNPLQSRNAGGEDGFFAVLGPAGLAYHVSYYGGSGDDRIRGAVLLNNDTVRFAGSTGSTDLEQRNPWQPRGQRVDGFVADIGTDHLIGANELVIPKDGVQALNLRVGRTAFRPPVAYRSSDPERVRFVYFGKSFAELTAPAGANVAVESLADSGEVEITANVPGFLEKKVRVRLYPGAFIPNIPTGPLSTWSASPVPVWIGFYPVDPATGQAVGPAFSRRAGLPVPVFSWSSSDPGVLEIVQDPTFGHRIVPRKPGRAEITVTADGVPINRPSTTVNVGAPEFRTTENFRLGQDLQISLPLEFTFNGASVTLPRRGTLTARSENPGALLVSADSTQPGRETATIDLSQTVPFPAIWAQAIAADGQVRVIFTSTEFEGEMPLTVTLEPSRLRLGQSRFLDGVTVVEPVFTLVQGNESSAVALSLESESGNRASGIRPGVPPIVLKLTNSDPSVVELNRLTVSLPTSTEFYSLRPREIGVAELSLAVVGGKFRLVNDRVRVEVRPAPPAQSQFQVSATAFVGKDLQSRLPFSATSATGEIVVSSSDPSALLISTSRTARGSARVAVPADPAGRNEVYLQALKSEGQATIRLTAPGLSDREVAVSLLPAGVGFGSASTSFVSAGFDRSASVNTWALSESGEVKLAAQIPQPGVNLAVRLRSEGSSIRLSRESLELTAQSPEAEVFYTLPPAGQEAVLIAESAGIVPAPLAIARLPIVNVPQATTGQLNPQVLVRNELREVQLPVTAPSSTVEITASSSDPNLVLVGARATDPPAASVKLLPGSSPVVHLHALAESGTAAIRFEAPGRTATEMPVGFQPMVFSIPGVVIMNQGETRTATASLGFNRFRPGAEPLRFTVRSDDPGIVTIRPNAIEVGPNKSDALELRAIAPGSTQLVAEGPSGVFTPPSVVVVRPPQASSVRIFALGKNLQGAAEIDLGPTVDTTNPAIVTISSSDPARVLVSRNAGTPGSNTATVAVPAGSRTALVYVHALAADGEVALRATIQGESIQVASILLAPSWVGCTVSPALTIAVGDLGEINCGIRFTEGTVTHALREISSRLGEVRAPVFTSDPAVLTVGSQSLSFTQSTFAALQIRGVAAGTAEIRIEQPEGFGPAPGGSATLPVTVVVPTVPTGCGRTLILGKDTQITCEFGVREGVAVTARSENASLLLVSNNRTSPGSATATTASPNASIAIQALAAAGTAEVVFSAPGYADLRVAVAMRPTQLRLSVPDARTPGAVSLPRGSTSALSITLQVVGSFAATPRVGAIFAEFSMTPPGIVSIDPPRVTLGEQQISVPIVGVAPGSAIIRMTGPPGVTIVGSPITATVSP